MKITHHLKAKINSVNLAQLAYSGGSMHDLYYETYGILPSAYAGHIMNPVKPEYVPKWAEQHGFTAEMFYKTKHQLSDENEGSTITCNNDLRIMFSYRKGYANAMELHFFGPPEHFSKMGRWLDEIKDGVGSAVIKGRINLLGYVDNEFTLVPISIPQPDMSLELNYGTEFIEVHKKIESLLTPNDSGLMLFHGVPGSGKSTYIYYLIHNINKNMIYVPNNVMSKIANPEFVAFMVTSAQNSVLVIEDAEKILAKREGMSDDSGISTLLNLTDGVLGKVLKCKAICTFNIDRSSIDPALLRKGRLQLEHQFHALSVDQSNKLLAHLGKDRRTDEPLTLADIYNDAGGRPAQTKPIGFAK